MRDGSPPAPATPRRPLAPLAGTPDAPALGRGQAATLGSAGRGRPGRPAAPPRPAGPRARARAAPTWASLTADQRNLLAPFAEEWDSWLDGERRAWLALAARFPAMPPAEQVRARERIREWAQLGPEERRTARANFGMARRMPEH